MIILRSIIVYEVVICLLYLVVDTYTNNIWRILYPSHDTIFVDGSSAYQTVRRDISLEMSKKNLPGMASILHSLHENRSMIWINPGESEPVGISTEEGTTQGCGSGLLQHGFGAKSCYDRLQEKAQNNDTPASFKGYADDGTILGNTDIAIELLQQYRQEGPNSGLFPSITKTKVLLGLKPDAATVAECILRYKDNEYP